MSQFGAEKFTTRSREAIEAAQLAATTAGQHRTPSRSTCSSRCCARRTAPPRNLVTKAGVDAARAGRAGRGASLSALPQRQRRDRPAARRRRAALTRVLGAGARPRRRA